MVLASSQIMRYISWIHIAFKDIASIMYRYVFIPKPSHSDANIHIVFSSSDNNDIIFGCKSHFLSLFFSEVSSCLRSLKTIIHIHISIMYAGYSFFNNISSDKSFATNESTNFTHFLPLYILPPHILE